MADFQLVIDNLPKDKGGYRQLGLISASNAGTHAYTYPLGMQAYAKTDNSQSIDVASMAVWPTDNWKMVAANFKALTTDAVATLVTESLTAYDANHVGKLYLMCKTNTVRVKPTSAAYPGMYLGTGQSFTTNMKMADIALLQIINATAGSNATVEYAIFTY